MMPRPIKLKTVPIAILNPFVCVVGTGAAFVSLGLAEPVPVLELGGVFVVDALLDDIELVEDEVVDRELLPVVVGEDDDVELGITVPVLVCANPVTPIMV